MFRAFSRTFPPWIDEVGIEPLTFFVWAILRICLDQFLFRRTRPGLDRVIVFDNGKCSRKITSRSAHSTCSPRANRVDIPMPDGL
jgi:hypothetical protein